jgi:hypothetical protein
MECAMARAAKIGAWTAVALAGLGLVALHERWDAGEGSEAAMSATRQAPPSPVNAERVRADSSSHEARDVATASRASPPPAATDAPIQLTFRTPPAARVGDGIDLTVDVEGREAIGRIVLSINYDSTLLRLRSAEEIDYTNSAIVHARFALDDERNSSLTVSIAAHEGDAAIAGAGGLAIAQFEALAPGWASVAVSTVSVSGSGARQLSHRVVSREAQVAIN